MKLSTAINHQNRILILIKDHYSKHLIFRSPHKDMLKDKEKIFNDEGLKRCPQHVRSFLKGYDLAMWDEYWKNLKWVVPFEGVNYDRWDDLPERGKEAYRNGASGCHVYKVDPERRFNEPKKEGGK